MTDRNDADKTPLRPVSPTVVSSIDFLPQSTLGLPGQYIYLLEADGVTKVGVSKNPKSRARTISLTSGRPMSRAAFAGPFPRATTVERELRDQFAEKVVHGSEWVAETFDRILQELALMAEPKAAEPKRYLDGANPKDLLAWSLEPHRKRTEELIKARGKIANYEEAIDLAISLTRDHDYALALQTLMCAMARNSEDVRTAPALQGLDVDELINRAASDFHAEVEDWRD